MAEKYDGKNPMVIPRAIVNKGGVRSATLSDDETFTLKTSTINMLDPGGADRTLTLPAVASTIPKTDGLRYVIAHSGVANLLNISDGAAVVAVAAGEWVEVSSEGTDWFVSARGVDVSRKARVEVFDDFNRQANYATEADGPWILNAGADAQALDPAISTVGISTLTTGDADGTMANDGSQIVAALPVQAQYGGLVVEARLHINTAITDVSVNFGLTDVTTLEEPAAVGGGDAITTNATDCAVLVYDTGADTDEWFSVAADGGVDDSGSGATGTAPVADTYQILRIEVESDGATIRFYIDGTLETTMSGDVGVSPDVALYATVTACSTTTTSKTVDVDYIYIQQGSRA